MRFIPQTWFTCSCCIPACCCPEKLASEAPTKPLLPACFAQERNTQVRSTSSRMMAGTYLLGSSLVMLTQTAPKRNPSLEPVLRTSCVASGWQNMHSCSCCKALLPAAWCFTGTLPQLHSSRGTPLVVHAESCIGWQNTVCNGGSSIA